MSIRLKWIGLWLIFGFMMLSVFVASHHYLLKSTILYYVDQRDHQHLERLKTNLDIIFAQQQLDSATSFNPFIWLPVLRLSSRVDLSQTDRPLDMILERFSRRPPPPEEALRRFAFEQRVTLLDRQGQMVLGIAQPKYDLLLPITRNQQVVAQLGYVRSDDITEQTDIEFAKVQEAVLKIGALFILLIALLMLWPVNRLFIKPMQLLGKGLAHLAAGDYAKRIHQPCQDEWAQLAQHFNHLALTLEKAQQSRSQWIADISHELRTPVTVLRSSVESMQEGVRPINEKTLNGLHEEVLLLNRLIDDLYQLSLHDVGAMLYQMKPLDLTLLLSQSLQGYKDLATEKGLSLELKIAENLPKILADEGRILQLFNNLLLNAIAYTDPLQADGRAGVIKVELLRAKEAVKLVIADSAPGVSADEMSLLSDYWYRAESSRNRRLGGAGLGLAICKKIADAHQTQLTFAASPLGGLAVTLLFPLSEQGLATELMRPKQKES